MKRAGDGGLGGVERREQFPFENVDAAAEIGLERLRDGLERALEKDRRGDVPVRERDEVVLSFVDLRGPRLMRLLVVSDGVLDVLGKDNRERLGPAVGRARDARRALKERSRVLRGSVTHGGRGRGDRLAEIGARRDDFADAVLSRLVLAAIQAGPCLTLVCLEPVTLLTPAARQGPIDVARRRAYDGLQLIGPLLGRSRHRVGEPGNRLLVHRERRASGILNAAQSRIGLAAESQDEVLAHAAQPAPGRPALRHGLGSRIRVHVANGVARVARLIGELLERLAVAPVDCGAAFRIDPVWY